MIVFDRKGLLFIVIALASQFPQPSFARMFGGGGNQLTQSIGGVPVGTQGTGIYSGYTMAGGETFSTASIVDIANPLARYFPTEAYENGTRGNGTLLKSYDSDPFNPGHQDANQGVPLGSNTVVESGGNLVLNSLYEDATETGTIGSGKSIISGMIHTGGYLTFSAPVVVEAYMQWSNSAATPEGWHPTFWALNTSPLNEAVTSAGEEWDFTEGGIFNYNAHGAAPTGTAAGNVLNLDGNWHLITATMTTAGVTVYKDGTSKGSSTIDATATALPYYLLFTNHAIPSNALDWVGSTASMNIAWYRVWIPNAQYPSRVLQPTGNLPSATVSYGSSMTYTFPAATTLWGSNISDYCYSIPFEDYEPGCPASSGFNCGYGQFPAGLSYNSGTRVLTGITSESPQQPGRLHTACVPSYQSGGGLGYVARGYIDVGPTISPTSISYSNGSGSFSVYSMGNCGDLVPKTMTVTGLPGGLSFNASNFIITGTATTGSYTISVGVTNSSGQSATHSVSLTVGS